MQGITLNGSQIIYYNSPAGYIENGRAFLDPIFKAPELEAWVARKSLPAEWVDGVYDRLSAGGFQPNSIEATERLKACRVWQLRPDAAMEKKFVPYSAVQTSFGGIQLADYDPVYTGQVETNDLAALDEKFSTGAVSGYTGHPLAISDLIELYDEAGGEFYYADRRGLVPVEPNTIIDRGAPAPEHDIQFGGT